MKENSFKVPIMGILCCVLWVGLSSCSNPFAPAYKEGDLLENLLGDPSTVEGFFTRFKSSYQLRDTTLYGPLIHPDFEFFYRDYEQNIDINWGRVEELNSTGNLFQFARDIDLNWNNIITRAENTDKTESLVIRRFELVVVLEGSEVIRTDGSANFLLIRPDSLQTWQVIRWRDQSEL
jgi:hypothetical protein